MTVVNPKSISGINSITTGSGSDDILTIHTNNGTERLRIDSTGTTKIVTGIVTTLTATTGIVTTLTTNTLTANSTTKVGSGVTLSPDGDVFFTGITTVGGNADIEGALVVGNGVAAPLSGFSAHFHADATSNRIQITTSNTGVTNADGAIIMIDSGSNMEILNRENTNIEFFTNNSQRMTLDSSGRLLLGTTTEGQASADDLTIATSGNTGITLRSGTSNAGNIYFSDATSGSAEYAGYISYSHSTGSLSFGSNDGTERVRITSGGDVQVGSASSVASLRFLDVYNTSNGSNTHGSILRLITSNAASTGTTSLDMVKYKDGNFYITNNESTGGTHFYNGGATRASILPGGGISFNGDTAAANSLDDYEEGTWTPSLSGFTNGGTNDNATYVKIGQIVQIGLNIYQSSNNMSWVSGASIAGLPFAPAHLQGVFIGGYNNKDTEGAYLVSDGSGYRIILMSGLSGVRHLWTTFVYRTTQSGT